MVIHGLAEPPHQNLQIITVSVILTLLEFLVVKVNELVNCCFGILSHSIARLLDDSDSPT